MKRVPRIKHASLKLKAKDALDFVRRIYGQPALKGASKVPIRHRSYPENQQNIGASNKEFVKRIHSKNPS